MHKPQVIGSPALKELLLSNCPILHQEYKPTFWCFGPLCQTILGAVLRFKPKDVSFRRELFSFEDGGQTALDWNDDEHTGAPYSGDSNKRPIVLFLPGITGDSQSNYLLHLVQQARNSGFRSVVLNYRGGGGTELLTARVNNGENSSDVLAVINTLKKRYPHAPLIATGISLGGILLKNYLVHSGNNSRLDAAITISSAWNLFETSKSIEEPVNYFLFNRVICDTAKANFLKHKHMFENNYDIESILQSKTIRDFDDRFIAKHYNYPTWKEYYDKMTLHVKVDQILTPLIAINAGDDPFARESSLPLGQIRESKYIAMILTQYGGHVGFLEGILPTGKNYVDHLFSQLIMQLVQNKHKLLTL